MGSILNHSDPPSAEPNPNSYSKLHLNQKLSTHKQSRFKPYDRASQSASHILSHVHTAVVSSSPPHPTPLVHTHLSPHTPTASLHVNMLDVTPHIAIIYSPINPHPTTNTHIFNVNPHPATTISPVNPNPATNIHLNTSQLHTNTHHVNPHVLTSVHPHFSSDIHPLSVQHVNSYAAHSSLSPQPATNTSPVNQHPATNIHLINPQSATNTHHVNLHFPTSTHHVNPPSLNSSLSHTSSSSQESPSSFSSPPPVTSNTAIPISTPFSVPAIISRAKGKSRTLWDDYDIPLAQLKKMKYGTQVLDPSTLDVERAAFSLTKLHGDTLFKGSVNQFLNSPLLDSHGHVMDFLTQYGHGPDALNQNSALSFTTAICEAPSFLQVTNSIMSTSLEGSELSPAPFHMDIQQVSPFTSSVAVSPTPVTRRFHRVSRGKRPLVSDTATVATSSPNVDILGECPLKPPPQL